MIDPNVFGQPLATFDLSCWYDIEGLKAIQQKLIALSSPSGLYFCTRIAWPPTTSVTGVDADYTEAGSCWEEFLGDVPTFDHEVHEGEGTHIHQSCFFGDRAKLDEFTSAVATASGKLPGKIGIYLDSGRDSSVDRHQWALGLLRASYENPSLVSADGRGAGAYKRWRMDRDRALELLFGPETGSDHLQNHFSEVAKRQAFSETMAPPYIYAAIRTDVFDATVRIVDKFLADIELGKVGPKEGLIQFSSSCRPVPFADTLRKFGLPSSDSSPEAPSEPTWEFSPAEFRFAGITAEITPAPKELLRRLTASAMWKTAEDLQSELNVSRESLRGDISNLRKLLRKAFRLESNQDPIPSRSAGRDLMYRVDEALLHSSIKSQSACEGS